EPNPAVGSRETDHRPVHRGVAVRVQRAGRGTGDLGGLTRLGVRPDLVDVHLIEHSTLAGFEAVNRARDRTVPDGVEDVPEVLVLDELSDRGFFDHRCRFFEGDLRLWCHGGGAFRALVWCL